MTHHIKLVPLLTVWEGIPCRYFTFVSLPVANDSFPSRAEVLKQNCQVCQSHQIFFLSSDLIISICLKCPNLEEQKQIFLSGLHGSLDIL